MSENNEITAARMATVDEQGNTFDMIGVTEVSASFAGSEDIAFHSAMIECASGQTIDLSEEEAATMVNDLSVPEGIPMEALENLSVSGSISKASSVTSDEWEDLGTNAMLTERASNPIREKCDKFRSMS